MLLLTRKAGQKIIIGDNVEITVLEVRGRHVKLGINAPKEVPVHREEIYQRIKAEEEQKGEGDQGEDNTSKAKIQLVSA